MPVDSDPPPSFTVSGREAQECLVPTHQHVLGVGHEKGGFGQTGNRRNDGTARSPLMFQSFVSVTSGPPPLKVHV